MSDRNIIQLLADGEFHSGEALGAALGVSRAAVWKQLQKLEKLGIHVESVRGRGYRIAGGMELLDRDRILGSLPPAVVAGIADFALCDELESTNSYLLSESVHQCVCVAERQTGGRGRRGRRWVSPYGRNLYLSVGWRFDGGAAAVEGLSLAVGVALRRAVASVLPVEGLGLKWPNDLLLHGRKVGGVLVELTGDPSDLCNVVVGVGLNLKMNPSEAGEVDQPWANLCELGDVPRNRLCAAVIAELFDLLSGYGEMGFAPWREEWEGCDISRDQAVVLSTPAASVEGVARGVADTGALRLETADGIRLLSGGEMSMRSAR